MCERGAVEQRTLDNTQRPPERNIPPIRVDSCRMRLPATAGVMKMADPNPRGYKLEPLLKIMVCQASTLDFTAYSKIQNHDVLDKVMKHPAAAG